MKTGALFLLLAASAAAAAAAAASPGCAPSVRAFGDSSSGGSASGGGEGAGGPGPGGGSAAGGGGASSGGGSATGGSGGSGGGTGAAGGAGGAFTCTDFSVGEPACDDCLHQRCCDQLEACFAVESCRECVETGDPVACEDPAVAPLLDTLTQCYSNDCGPECGVPPSCNPVTNAPCDAAAGEACDISSQTANGFGCYPPPNDVALCGACDGSAGPYCRERSTCANGACARFCCDGGDCATGSVCDLAILGLANVGVCISPTGGPDCAPPEPSPSQGLCVAF